MPELRFKINKRELHAATDGDIIYLTFIENLLVPGTRTSTRHVFTFNLQHDSLGMGTAIPFL